jgi:site-specific recombinase XerD
MTDKGSWGGSDVGRVKERKGRDGRTRYTACYLDIRGRERSAGTYGNKKQAERAWHKAEVKVAEGRAGDPRRGRQTFERYVRDEWLPNHVMELRTRENYVLYLERVILPTFGPMKMIEILPSHVREWVVAFQKGTLEHAPRRKGQRATIKNSPAVIEYCMVILSAIFTTALNDQIVYLHPCKGVKTPALAKKVRQIITPEQFDVLHSVLPDDMRLLVEADIESGLRWGELTELRVKDLNRRTRMLTVARVVVELSKPFQVDGKRFVVKEYPKDEEHRQFRLSKQIVDKIDTHIEAIGLGPEDLLFAIRSVPSRRPLRTVPNPATLGLTAPNDKGRRYCHGTMTAYGLGKCRCQHCKDACAIYRAQRRAHGKDCPRQLRTLTTDGHIPRSWFRTKVWGPARDRAALDSSVRVYDLRHAHASWLLAGGADIQVVKERLGHGSIVTTQKYLHSLPEADDAAVDAFTKIRRRSA